MTASSKKKREKKQKDFQAPKAKPSNFTDTSFKSKALVIATQSLHQTAPSQTHLLAHHLSLLTHHSDTTRRESLSYLTTHLPPTFPFATSLVDGQSTLPASALIPALAPMILDASNSVRSQLLTLLKTLPQGYVEMYVPKLMLYITSAMTHLAPEIRGDSTKYLIWLLGINTDSVLRNGGWAKGLRGLIGVLGWGTAKDNGCISSGGNQGAAARGKIRMQHISVLREFLQAGLLGDHVMNQLSNNCADDGHWQPGFSHWTTHLHMLPNKPSRSNAFSYLSLFSMAQSSDGENAGTEDLEARKRWLVEGPGKDALGSLRLGVEDVRKEGGEMGRLGARIAAVLDDALNTEGGEE
ncbi:putative rRNA processing protein Ipi1 [Tirmania nivea]|nr:putative rRNA processing protein Ipi1 [Tirmania nivea]